MRETDAAAVRARVGASSAPRVECFDGEPDQPPSQYAVLYDGAQYTPLGRLSAHPVDERTTFRVVVIARTRDGLRAAVTAVRAQLIGWRVQATFEPVHEVEAGDVLPTGESGDRRLSQTLVFRYTRPFGGNP